MPKHTLPMRAPFHDNQIMYDADRPVPHMPWRNPKTVKKERDFGPIGRLTKKERKFFNTVCNNLTTLLRSSAPSIGMQMRKDGYVRTTAVLEYLRSDQLMGRAGYIVDPQEKAKGQRRKNLTLNISYLKRMAKTAGFRRRTFRFNVMKLRDEFWIRANYGHSAVCGLDPRAIRTLICNPKKVRNVIYAGQREELVDIFENGISPNMPDGTIRCATCVGGYKPKNGGVPQASGMNAVVSTDQGAQTMVWVNVRKCLKDGVQVFINAINELIVEPPGGGPLPFEYVLKVAFCENSQFGLREEDWMWTAEDEEGVLQDLPSYEQLEVLLGGGAGSGAEPAEAHEEI